MDQPIYENLHPSLPLLGERSDERVPLGLFSQLTTQENTITYHNTLLLVTPKFCISIVFSFSWELKWPQEKLKKNAYAKCWSEQQRVFWYVMVFSGVVNSITGYLKLSSAGSKGRLCRLLLADLNPRCWFRFLVVMIDN